MKKRILAIGLVAGLVGCGGSSSISVDEARFALTTTLSGEPATTVALGGDADNFVTATMADSLIGAGKVYSERRSDAGRLSVAVDWQGKHYVESLKHDTWSRVEVNRTGTGLSVSVAGKFITPTTGDYIEVDWSTVEVPASVFQ